MVRIKKSPEIASERAFVLHTRGYRETSLLVDVFSKEHGRINVVAQGAKKLSSKYQGLLQPFIPLSLTWRGTGTLFNLADGEMLALPNPLVAKNLVCGLYLNEILVRLLPLQDSHIDLFEFYEQTLDSLRNNIATIEISLRRFEKFLLKSIGYELPLLHNQTTGVKVEQDKLYSFDTELGPTELEFDAPLESNALVFKGKSFIALAEEKFETKEDLAAAKRIMRKALAQHLGDKPLMARKLF